MANAPVFPLLQEGLPPIPPEALDPYLDAGARCFARYGISRTTMPDIAREVGVSRTTVYRQVGSIDQLLWMLASRETHRLIATLPGISRRLDGPQALVRLMASTVVQIQRNPVVSKVLSDEPDVVGPLLASDLSRILNEATEIATPLLAAAMRAGMLADRDPATTANWLVRMAVSLIVSPPPGDLDAFLSEILVPALSPPHEPTGGTAEGEASLSLVNSVALGDRSGGTGS